MFKHGMTFLLTAAALALPAAEYHTVSPRPGVTQLLNDNGQWPNVSARGLSVLSGHTARVRKVFDLSKLPAGTLEKAKKAALQVHVGIVDHSLRKKGKTPNGLSEEFVIAINGHEMVFHTGDARFPSMGIPANLPGDADSIGIARGQTEKQMHGWADVEFPVEWIRDGKMTVEIYKRRSPNNDDFVMIGWDISVPNGCSFFTTDNGKKWEMGTGAQPKGKGEYLMRLTLSENAGEKLDLSAPPKIDLNPTMKPARGTRSNAAPECRIDGDRAFFVNQAMRAEFILRPNLSLKSLIPAELDYDVVGKHTGLSRLFRIKVGGKILDAANMPVRQITPVKNGFRAELADEASGLTVLYAVRADSDELRFDCEIVNRGRNALDFMPAVPHVAGITLSEKPESDYYLFPHGGGTIANVAGDLRSVYGTDGCWWQMIDLFSPERGAGIYLRVDDPKAIYKGFALRKGVLSLPGCSLRHSSIPGRDPLIQFTDALEKRDGIGITVDYQQFTRQPGKNLVLPSACLGTHPGNWKNAMPRYVAWSKKTWPPRPANPKLKKVWTGHGGIGHTAGTAGFSTGYLKNWPNRQQQSIEQDSYWTLSTKGPFGVSREEYEKVCKSLNRKPGGWIDPVTGKWLYPWNRGDYDGYNPDWGGLPAFRKYIDFIKSSGRVFTLYTDPVIACHNTKNGPELARKYGVINPDWRDHSALPGITPKPPVVTAYSSYVLDINAEGYPEWITRTMVRLIRDTQADGIRFDEYGHRGYICLSKDHKHLFGEFGQNCWLDAVCHSIELTRREFDKIDPGLIIKTEFPGHDRMASLLDGALSYNICRRIGTLAPLPLNLFRMYFPECKLFEFNARGPKDYWEYAMWNGIATCPPIYPWRYLKVLNKYADIFSGDMESLVPSLAQYVYINRFSEPGKPANIYTLFNMTGKDFRGAVLPAKQGFHYVDLFTEKLLVPTDGKIALAMPEAKLGVIGEFPGEPPAGMEKADLNAAVSAPAFSEKDYSSARWNLAKDKAPAKAPAKVDGKVQSIADIDPNFKSSAFKGEDLKFRDVLSDPVFGITGFPWRKPGEPFHRLPLENKFSPVLNKLSFHTSGGMVRFTTNARRIAIRAKLKYAWDSSTQPRTGRFGFDFYLMAGSGRDSFWRNIPADRAAMNGKLIEAWVFRTPIEKPNFTTWTLYLPTYGGVELLELGFNDGAEFKPNPPQKIAKPIVFYGSSITQGGCTSRPGNNYTTLLCRVLDAPEVNLGFSGSARGEEEMAKLIASLDMAAFVMDYDYNSPNAKHLAETHAKFFKIIRQAHPDLPIVVLSRCTLYTDERTAIIRKTCEEAKAAGDKKVWFVEGASLIDKEAKIAASVDGCHPNDLGFYLMYRNLLPVFAEIFDRKDLLK